MRCAAALELLATLQRTHSSRPIVARGGSPIDSGDEREFRLRRRSDSEGSDDSVLQLTDREVPVDMMRRQRRLSFEAPRQRATQERWNRAPTRRRQVRARGLVQAVPAPSPALSTTIAAVAAPLAEDEVGGWVRVAVAVTVGGSGSGWGWVWQLVSGCDCICHTSVAAGLSELRPTLYMCGSRCALRRVRRPRSRHACEHACRRSAASPVAASCC